MFYRSIRGEVLKKYYHMMNDFARNNLTESNFVEIRMIQNQFGKNIA